MRSKKNACFMQLGLIASLVVNLILIGFILSSPLGRVLNFDPFTNIYNATSGLSPDSKKKVITIINEKRPLIQGNVKEFRQSFAYAREQLTSKDLTKEDIQKITDDMKSDHEKMSNHMSDMLVTVLASFSNENERIMFFEKVLPKNPPIPPFFEKSATAPSN